MFYEKMYKSRRNKLRTYELLSIIKPNIDSEEFDKIVAKIEENIATLGGKVVSTDKMGRKKLSYDIKDFRDGYFVVHNFELEPNQVEKFNRQLRLNENILRIMLLEVSAVKA
jgi:small subunit ribosomal protein S6